MNIPKKMEAAVFYGPYNMKVEEVTVPEIDKDDVLIKVKYCGICGTDPHIFSGSFPAPVVPFIPGHEFSGKVVKVGSTVNTCKPGDKVTADINVACDTCYYCKRRAKFACPHLTQIGVQCNGAYAEYVKVPEKAIIKLPKEMSYKLGALVEPLSCVLHGLERIKLNIAGTLVIIGAGTMGLLLTQVARIRGSVPIIVSEIDENRIKKAKEVGADIVINAKEEDAVEKVRSVTNKRGADYVIECVGSITTYEQALKMLRPGGSLLFFGATPDNEYIKIKPYEVFRNEWNFFGTYAGSYDNWPKAVSLLNSGRINVDPIISKIGVLKNVVNEIKQFEENKKMIKVLISPEK